MSPIHIGMKRRERKEISLRNIRARRDFLKNNPDYIPLKYRKAADRLAKREVNKALAKAEYESQPLEGPRTGPFGSVRLAWFHTHPHFFQSGISRTLSNRA